MEARNYTPPPQITSQHEFKLDSNIHYDRDKIAALPSSRLAVAVNKRDQSSHVEIWDFADYQKRVVAELKMDSHIEYLNVSPSGKLYIGHGSKVSVWDAEQKNV